MAQVGFEPTMPEDGGFNYRLFKVVSPLSGQLLNYASLCRFDESNALA